MNAILLLLKFEPWYGHAAVSIDWERDDSVDTMGVSLSGSGKVKCRYSIHFVKQLTDYEIAAVIQHEIEHVVRGHISRSAAFNKKLWNIAADMVVNGKNASPRIGLLDAQTSQRVIPYKDDICWLPQNYSDNETVESCYQKLLQDNEMRGKIENLNILDNHQWNETLDPAIAKGAARTLVHAASLSSCTEPSHLKDSIAKLKRNQISWRTLLRRFVKSNLIKKEKSINRLSRRTTIFGMPGYKNSADRPSISVVVDVSGSVTNHQLELFFGEIESLQKFATLKVLFWDTANQGFYPKYQSGQWKSIRFGGRGGTDMIAPVSWLKTRKHVGDAMIMFTDGYCHWPARQAFPWLVVCSSPQSAIQTPAWGKIVFLEQNG